MEPMGAGRITDSSLVARARRSPDASRRSCARGIFLTTLIALGGLLASTPASAQKPTSKPGATKPEPKADTTKDSSKADPPKDAPKTDAAAAAEPSGEPKADPGTGAANIEPPAETWDPKNVEELPGKTYLFVGLRYRGNIVPQFMLNMFVDEGKTIYSNSVGIELDMRKDGFSLIPALQYTEYGTGDVLFKEKNTPDIPGNYTVVNSSMKAFYATADLLWSTPISKNLSFEYGAGFGLGVIFGDLENNWVKLDPSGDLSGSNGKKYSRCRSEGEGGTGSGCNKADHQNASKAKVGGYTEDSWFSGGSKPVLFPWIAVPQIGLRFKPVKQFVGRLGLGFSLTGFWFGLNGEYGLEQKPKP